MILTIANRQRALKINARVLREIAGALLEEMAGPDATLEINLVSSTQMARVNQTHLQHEGPTDVITFDYREAVASSPLHGELFICPTVAVEQAREFGTDWPSELVRYVIHGVLHLLGHDDLQPGPRRRMKRAEGRWLGKISRRFALRNLAGTRILRHGKKKSPRALAG